MAVKRYNGSSWDVVAGLGAQGPAATSSSIATWVKTASGGETSLSGNDDNSQSLSYTVGQELVFINGALQKRDVDYTATTGTSITGLTALAASDVVTVWTVNAFSVTNAISNTLVDAKGDLITATGADVPARLAVGTNGYVLTADSTQSTGLKWSAAGKILQVVSTTKTDTFSSSTTGAFTDITGMSVSITPAATSSKVLVFADMSVASTYNNTGVGLRLMRDSTAINIGDAASTRQRSTAAAIGSDSNFQFSLPMHYLDSPSTTSSTTYKVQFYIGAGTFYLNRSPNDTDSSGLHRTVSTITVMEIGA